MEVSNFEFHVATRKREELIDITSEVNSKLASLKATNGICIVAIPHTTAGVTLNENADPSVKADIMSTLSRLIPDNGPYLHAEGNSPAHIKASLIGHQVIIPILGGKLALGRWQGILLAEFDGPRTRSVRVSVIA